MLRTLFVSLSLFVTVQLLSQDYYPFPESDAMWRCGWGENGCALNDQYAEYQYLITGDTVIGTLTYHKLDRSGVFDCAPPLYPWSGYMGAFRNDIDARRVYFVPVDSISESLIYDFTLDIGDTIQGYLPDPENWGSPNIAVISAIDSIEIANGYRKRWHFESSGDINFNSGFVIEGIGGEFGPLEALMARFDNNGSLNCFTHNSALIYTPDISLSCEIASGVRVEDRPNILIHADPITDQLVISGALGVGFVQIYDINGRLVKTLALRSAGEHVSIPIADLPVAHYQIRVISDQSIWWSRFVKVD